MLDRQRIYRLLLRALPAPRYDKNQTGMAREIAAILSKHRAAGASVAFFSGDDTPLCLCVGTAGQMGPVTQDTFFRVASISKMITALCVLRLAQDGLISLDRDINAVLPFAVRHPQFPNTPITLRMLLSHTSGLVDAPAYHQGVGSRVPVSAIIPACWGEHAPGTSWEYSNLGAGLVASVLEAALDQSFENIMRIHLFDVLGVEASFYPQRISGALADAYRVIPPWGKSGFDARERKKRPAGDADIPQPERHYGLAQGNCVTNMAGMLLLLKAAMQPRYLDAPMIAAMRSPLVSFGQRSPYMQQGMGLFVIDEPGICAHTLYGHQGNAYGAMHGAFFDPIAGRGMVLLTSAASEAKTNFLSDINRDLMRLCFSSKGSFYD